MHWRTLGGIALALLAVLLLWPGCDCLRVGLRALRHEPREYERRVGLATAATGLGLLLLATLLGWASWTLRR